MLKNSRFNVRASSLIIGDEALLWDDFKKLTMEEVGENLISHQFQLQPLLQHGSEPLRLYKSLQRARPFHGSRALTTETADFAVAVLLENRQKNLIT